MNRSAFSTGLAAMANFFKTSLDDLECHLVEDVSDAYINELLFTPGEHRLQIIQWLLAENNEKFRRELSEPLSSHARIEKLLLFCHALCLCDENDYAMIQGSAPSDKQMQFFKALITLTLAKKKRAVREMRGERQIDVSKALSALADSHDRTGLLNRAWRTMPLDIEREVAHRLEAAGFRSSQSGNAQLPDYEKYREDMNNMRMMLIKVEEKLAKMSDVSGLKLHDSMHLQKQFALCLSALHQIAIGYKYSFMNDFDASQELRDGEVDEDDEAEAAFGNRIRVTHNQLKSLLSVVDHLSEIQCSGEAMLATNDWQLAVRKLSTLLASPITDDEA